MRVSIVFLLWMALLPPLVQAETAYITDKLFVSIRDGQGNESPAVKSVATGTKLEVLQRLAGFALVREPGGAEGWIAERYLVDTAPGKATLNITLDKLKLANNELTTLKQRLAESGKMAREEKARASALAQKLQRIGASSKNNAESGDNRANAEISGAAQGPAQDATMPSGFNFSWLWLLISFAMLVTGFIAGVIWLRELNRKKMGGMYLRI